LSFSDRAFMARNLVPKVQVLQSACEQGKHAKTAGCGPYASQSDTSAPKLKAAR